MTATCFNHCISQKSLAKPEPSTNDSSLERGDDPDADIVADIMWQRFEGTTDLSRPARGGTPGYSLHDATRIRGSLGEISGAHVSEAAALWPQTISSTPRN